MTTTTGNGGLFGKTQNALIQGVTVANCRFFGSKVGGIVGYAYCGTNLIKCNNYSNISVSGGDVGGICGYAFNENNNGLITIQQCNNYGTISGNNNGNCGGICGNVERQTDIMECTNSGDVNGQFTGGIVGFGKYLFRTLYQCINNGNISSFHTSGQIGGIIGYINAQLYIYDCINTGTMITDYATNIAGLVGENVSGGQKMQRCLNIGTIQTKAVASAISTSGNLGAALACTYNYYNSDICPFKAVSKKDDATNYGMTTAQLSNGTLPTGFSTDYWAIRTAEVKNMKKYYYYPYLKCFGPDSAILAQVKDCHTVSINLNGGTTTDNIITFYVETEQALLPTNVQKAGCTFDGWYDNSNYTSTPYTEVPLTETQPKNFYAKWIANNYSITYELDGGTINSGKNTTYTYGYGVTLPTDITKTGYSFKGWYDNSSYTGDPVQSVLSTETGDKEFYAKWDVNSYNITYVTNNGTINDDEYAKSFKFGVGATLPADVTKTGYTFGGWYTNDSYSGDAISAISTTDFGDKTYYAKWKVNSYDVTLNSNGGTVNSGNIASYTYGVGATLPTDITKTGYTFAGWYDNSSCSGSAVLSIASNATDDKEFWAKWDTINYTITYNANKGEFAVTPVSNYKYGDEIVLATPTREGYEFGGWYNNSNLVGTEFMQVASTETGNKEFWAKWNVNSYTVAFETNGGTINSGRIKNYVYGTTIVLPYDVTKTGYTFDGWYTNEDCSGEAILSILSTDLGNKTFYANWVVNTYNITLVTYEGTIAEEQNIDSYEYNKGETLPTDVTKEGYTFSGWYTNSSYIGGSVTSVLPSETGDKTFYAKWTVNEYKVSVDYDKVIGTVTGEDYYEYKSTATLKAIANEGYEFVGWNDNELKDERIQLTVTKDTTLVANFKEKEKVQIAGSLEIPTLKTEREAQPIDLSGLFTTTEGGEVTYTATSSAPNVVSATVSEGKLFLTVFEYEGEAEITVTATLPNGEKNSVNATAEVILACNIQVEETITNVSCYGESDGGIALKVTNAAEPYTTLWTGATATTDTIKDVKAGNYEVVITDNENCTFIKTYTVSQPEEMKLSAKIKNPTCDNADGSITITLTGAENASFAWSNESTAQNVANLVKGDYSVVITNTETGCQISDSYTLTEPEAPVVAVSNVVSTACNESNGAVTISVSEEGLLYSWSNNKTTKNLTNVPAGDYTLSVVNPETNCTATLAVTVPSIKLKQPEIALVTVSQESGKNLVVWLKENTDLIDYYTIYRVDSAKNKYDKVVDVPYSELSVYEDLAANPMERAWKYKMTATDVCGEETAMSDYHSSLHLMKVKSLGVENHLMWDPYEGIDFDSYVILRKTKVKGVVEIDTLATVPSDLTSYTDTLPARGTTSYYVGVKLPETINPKTQFLKAESGPFSIALSNIAEVENYVSVQTIVKSNAEVYAIGHTIYVKNAEYAETAVYDVNGSKINFAKDATEYEFDIKLDGVYLVKVGNETFKVVIK